MAVSYCPEGARTVTPHLVLRGAEKALEFYKKAFGAVEVMRMPGPDGKGVMHAEIQIGDSLVYLADEWPGMYAASPEKLNGSSVTIHLYVKDCDAVFNQAWPRGRRCRCRS